MARLRLGAEIPYLHRAYDHAHPLLLATSRIQHAIHPGSSLSKHVTLSSNSVIRHMWTRSRDSQVRPEQVFLQTFQKLDAPN